MGPGEGRGAPLGGYGFAGEQTDSETGFVYLRARSYDPATGRFLQPDAAGAALADPASQDAYGYALDAPTALVDPSGHDPLTATLGILGAAATAATEGVEFTVSLPEVVFVGSAVAVGFAIGAAIDRFAGTPAYTGDTGQQLSTPVYAGDTGQTLSSPAYGGAPWPMTSGPALYGGDTRSTTGGLAPAVEDFSLLASSRQLGNNLTNAGNPAFAGAEAHHIVAENALRALGARRILSRYGVGINDAANGVWLQGPGGAQVPGYPNAHPHRPIHTKTYYAEVENRLTAARSTPDVIAILDDIRSEILAGTFPR